MELLHHKQHQIEHAHIPLITVPVHILHEHLRVLVENIQMGADEVYFDKDFKFMYVYCGTNPKNRQYDRVMINP